MKNLLNLVLILTMVLNQFVALGTLPVAKTQPMLPAQTVTEPRSANSGALGAYPPPVDPTSQPTPAPTTRPQKTLQSPKPTQPTPSNPELRLSAEPAIYIPGKPVRLLASVRNLPATANARLVIRPSQGIIPADALLANALTADHVLNLPASNGENSLAWNAAPDQQPPFSFAVELQVDGKKAVTSMMVVDLPHTRSDTRSSGNTIRSSDDKVEVDVPEGAAAEPLVFEVRTPASHKMPPVSLSGRPVEIIAAGTNSGKNVTHFNRPITIRMKYDPGQIFDWPESTLQVFYYNETNHDWYPLKTQVDTTQHVLIAESDHLTTLDFKPASWQAHTLPTLDAFKTSDFTGAGIYAMNFWTPPGPGGVQPELSLTYNSQVVDSSTAYTQAAWVGMGWSLDTGAITRNLHGTDDNRDDDTFSIQAGGIGGLILPVGEEIRNGEKIEFYNTAEQSFVKIEYNTVGKSWTVYGKDGNLYEFNVNDRVRTSAAPSARPTCANDNTDLNLPWRWSLTTMRDRNQNEIHYTYFKETKSSDCWNEIAVYPETITYANGRYRVRFEREARGDYQDSWTDPLSKVLYGTQRLKAIVIEHNPAGSWVAVRRYAFTYVPDNTSSNHVYPGIRWHEINSSYARTLTLEQVQETNGNGSAVLPPTTFTYGDEDGDGVNDGMHLTAVENGQGGRVEIQYEGQAYFADETDEEIHSEILSGTCNSPAFPTNWIMGSGIVRCDLAANKIQLGQDKQSDDPDELYGPGMIRHSIPEHLTKPGGMYRIVVRAKAIQNYSGVVWGLADIETGDTQIPGSVMINQDQYWVNEQWVRMPGRYNPAQSTLQVECDDCRLEYVKIEFQRVYYRVKTRIVIDTITGKQISQTYAYDNPASNSATTSAAVRQSGGELYSEANGEYRGNARVQTTRPDGTATLDWFYQSDALKGRSYHTLSLQQSFVDGLDAALSSDWTPSASGISANIRLDGVDIDPAVKGQGNGTWSTTLERGTYALTDGKTAIAHLRLGSSDSEAEAGLVSADGRFFGLIARGGVLRLCTARVNGECPSTGQVLLQSLQSEQWYVVQLTVDHAHAFRLRIWQIDDPQVSAEATWTVSGAPANWKFQERVKNGALWLDAYLEGRLLAESETLSTVDRQYSMTGSSAGPDPYGPVTGGTVLNNYKDLSVFWTYPTRAIARTYGSGSSGQGSSLWIGTRTIYQYDSGIPAQHTYGNLLGTITATWNGTSWETQRATRVQYWPHDQTLPYLVNLPGSQETRACTNPNDETCATFTLTGATRLVYDNQVDYALAPSAGRLTAQRTLLRLNNGQPVYSDETYAYDTRGNRIRGTRYSGEGSATALASTGARSTEICYGVGGSLPGCAENGYAAYPLWQQNALGQRTTFNYDYAKGTPLSETDPNGVVTTYVYDDFGRITQLRSPGDETGTATISVTYAPADAGQFWTVVTQKIDATHTLSYRKYYNGLGELIQSQQVGSVLMDGACSSAPDGYADTCAVITDSWRGYLDLGSGQIVAAVKQTAPYAVAADLPGYLGTPSSGKQFWTRTLQDGMGRTVESLRPDGATERVSYDVVFRTLLGQSRLLTDTRTIDANQTAAAQPQGAHAYADGLGRVVAVFPVGMEAAVPQGPYMLYDYDTLNRLTGVRQVEAGGSSPFATTTIAYDLAGRKLSLNDPDMGEWLYTYDGTGNLVTQRDAKLQTLGLTYDLLDRLVEQRQGSVSGALLASYTYDQGDYAIGRRTAISGGDGAVQSVRSYDARGRVIQQSHIIPGVGSYVTAWSYNSADQVTTMIYPSGEVVNYTPLPQGAVGRLTSSSFNQVYVDSVGYDVAGRTRERTLGNGVKSTWSYTAWDQANQQGGRLSAARAFRTATPNVDIQNLTYNQYDRVGNLTQLVDGVANETLNFSYDSLNRLAQVTGAYNDTPLYDARGNLQRKTNLAGAALNLTYPTGPAPVRPHAVQTAGGNSYAYDANGNMTQRILSGVTYTLNYDSLNRLVAITAPNLNATYIYNADGARVKAVVTTNGVTRTTAYIGDYFEISVGQPRTTTPSGPGPVVNCAAPRRCAYVPQVGNSLLPIPPGYAWYSYYLAGADRVGLRVCSNQANLNDSLVYFLGDHLGGTSLTLDAGGIKTGELRYSAWGETRYTSGTTPTQRRYTNQLEAEAGLYFYNARWYDPVVGRFAQADNLVPDPTKAVGFDRYAYVDNNPVNFSDPTGHWSCSADEEGVDCYKWINEVLERLKNGGEVSRGAYLFFTTYDEFLQQLYKNGGLHIRLATDQGLMAFPAGSALTLASFDLYPFLGVWGAFPTLTFGKSQWSKSPNAYSTAIFAHEVGHIFQGFSVSLSVQAEIAGYEIQYLVTKEQGGTPDGYLEKLNDLWVRKGSNARNFSDADIEDGRKIIVDRSGGAFPYNFETGRPVLSGYYQWLYGGGLDAALNVSLVFQDMGRMVK